VFEISALAREGLDPLLRAIFDHVQAHKHPTPPEVDPRFDGVQSTEGGAS
jgi:GTP-binding protein